jgi:cytoskeletal protein RodZ
MTRNLKIMGLALVAAFALGASASAHEFTSPNLSEGETVHVTASSSNAVFSTKTAAVGIECETNEATDTAENPASEITVKPTYEGCTAGFLGKAWINRKGCAYVLFSETTTHKDTEGNDETDAPVTIECPEESHIDIESICPITIDDQEGEKLHGVSYDNGEDDVELTVTIDQIHYEGDWPEENNFLCETLAGLKSEANDGVYTGTFTVKSYYMEQVSAHVE